MKQTEIFPEKAVGPLEYNKDLLDFVRKDKGTADASRGQNMGYIIFKMFSTAFFCNSVTSVGICYKINAY